MKTIRQEDFGKTTIRLLQIASGYKAATIASGKIVTVIEGSDADALWREAVATVGQHASGFWGYEDARKRFRTIFPQGFADDGYKDSERTYKDVAAAFIRENIPLEAARNATSAHCELANKAFAKTNMATPIEKTRIQALLRSSKGPDYLAATAELADGDVGLALSKLDILMREHGQPSWPCATYLPFFWRPKTAMFLKPQITKEFAGRVGHPFVHAYDARLNGETYISLLDLASECELSISDLEPYDRIDVQSFIWVVGEYPDPK